MSDFNYQAYLKNNPLLQEEVKEEKLLTESQEIEETVEETVEEVAEETTEEIQEEAPSSKIKVSELKAKIKEDILSLLQEDEEEDIEVDVEDEVEVDVEEPALDADEAQEGLSADEKEIQDSLKIAYDNAVAIGDKKLADQIGNSITFFTRSHVVER
jgi:cytoskeletal protein RodZ